MAQKKPRTREEILRSNQRKMLNKAKIQVAEKEEIWLDLFQLVLPLFLGDEPNSGSLEHNTIAVEHARVITDEALKQYEDRWANDPV